MYQEKTIIPIAGGKGGIGKSLLTANLAVSLAKMGHKTVVVDLDLGGSNLHTFLGLPGDQPGIGNFIHARKNRINDYVVSTPWIFSGCLIEELLSLRQKSLLLTTC